MKDEKVTIKKNSFPEYMIVLIVYLVLLIIGKPVALFMTGFVAIFFSLVSLKKRNLRSVFFILSFIFILPVIIFFIFVLGGLLHILGLNIDDVSYTFELLFFITIVVSVIVAIKLIYKNFWKLVDPERRIWLVSVLIVLGVAGFLAGQLYVHCGQVSVYEKGVTESDIELCRTLSLYNPRSGSYDGISFTVFLTVYFPIFIMLIIVSDYFRLYSPRYKKLISKIWVED